MVQDLDGALRRLSAMPLHPELDSIEQAVLGRLHERTGATPRQGIGIGAIAATGALLLGIMAGGSFAAPASADNLSPFGPANPLAPSTLLAASR